ncbi:MAG: hypothetical protein V1495_10585 [Pseudomonadota bacterium]
MNARRIVLLALIAAFLPWSALAETGRKTRVNFDELVVHGQTKKADAVYVFDRGSLTQKDLTTQRKDYRKEILETMFK